MKIIVSLLLAGYWASALALAQTNSTPAKPESSLVPASEPPPPATPKAVDKAPDVPVTNGVPALTLEMPTLRGESSLLDDFSVLSPEDNQPTTTLNTEQELMLRYYERLNTAGYMNPTPAPATDLFSRTVNTLFQPEPVGVGKATVAFSPITAIKRKNPLALLNPIVLNISW